MNAKDRAREEAGRRYVIMSEWDESQQWRQEAFIAGAEWQASRPITDEVVDVVAKAAYVAQYQDKEWAERAWDDMGGSEPSVERGDYEIAIYDALEAARDA